MGEENGKMGFAGLASLASKMDNQTDVTPDLPSTRDQNETKHHPLTMSPPSEDSGSLAWRWFLIIATCVTIAILIYDGGRRGRPHRPTFVAPIAKPATIPQKPQVKPNIPTSQVPSKTSLTPRPIDKAEPTSSEIREAQKLLADLGHDPGPIDGKFGRRTASAVKRFQQKSGKTIDGRLDSELLSALRAAQDRNKR